MKRGAAVVWRESVRLTGVLAAAVTIAGYMATTDDSGNLIVHAATDWARGLAIVVPLGLLWFLWRIHRQRSERSRLSSSSGQRDSSAHRVTDDRGRYGDRYLADRLTRPIDAYGDPMVTSACS